MISPLRKFINTVLPLFIIIEFCVAIFGNHNNLETKNNATKISENKSKSKSKSSSTSPKKGVTGIDVVNRSTGSKASDFEYELNDSIIRIKRFKGSNTRLHLYSKYKVDKKTYTTDLSDMDFGFNKAKTVILHSGFKTIPTNLFNSSDVTTVYFPNTMTQIYDYCLSYIHADDDKSKVKIYYQGSQNQWNKIFAEYHRKSFKEAKTAYEKGASIADKLNEMMGGYDSSKYEFYFNASESDVK
jgi:hypothetical protein